MKFRFFALVLLFIPFSSFASLIQSYVSENGFFKNNSPQAQFNPAYIYQRQSMKTVNWLYVGFAPRQEIPEKLDLTISKGGYTLKVVMKMNKFEVADYPSYLSRRASEVNDLILKEGVSVYQWHAYQEYLAEVAGIASKIDTGVFYTEDKYQYGLSVLKDKFPQSVFMYPSASEKMADPKENVLEIVFVYPITINRAGASWPPDGEYIQKNAFSTAASAIQERRTDHGKRVWVDTDGDGKEDTKKRVITDYIFSGFPAFWIDGSGKGTGIHGPIRYSNKDQRGKRQSGPYGKSPEEMKKFWEENDFAGHGKSESDFEGVQYRWDVVRKNNSEGCFRAETMELRHLLPSDPRLIHQFVNWKVITDIDTYKVPGEDRELLVDVNYYVMDPYAFPMSREEWIVDRWLTPEQKKSDDPKLYVEEFIDSSIQFPYLNPATVEFRMDDGFNEYKSYQLMKKMNRAGQLPGL